MLLKNKHSILRDYITLDSQHPHSKIDLSFEITVFLNSIYTVPNLLIFIWIHQTLQVLGNFFTLEAQTEHGHSTVSTRESCLTAYHSRQHLHAWERSIISNSNGTNNSSFPTQYISDSISPTSNATVWLHLQLTGIWNCINHQFWTLPPFQYKMNHVPDTVVTSQFLTPFSMWKSNFVKNHLGHHTGYC